MTEDKIWLTDPVNGDGLAEFAEKIGLPPEYLAAAEPVAAKIAALLPAERDKFGEDLWKQDKTRELGEKVREEADLAMLAAGLLFGLRAHGLYRDRGIGDEVYYPSMRELTVWSKTCMRERGHIGFYEWGWFTNFLDASIVRLGRLEFHEVRFHDGLVWEKNGVTAKGGDRVINTHIPEDGPLDPDAVRDAFRRAYRYFGRTGKAVIVCDSWLLWPGNYDFLGPESRIRAFMDNFDIIDREDRKNSGDLWRVFGHRESYDPASLPRDTELRRRMADYLAKSGNVTGTGYGVLLFDGERVKK
jgi:hypothetical protein